MVSQFGSLGDIFMKILCIYFFIKKIADLTVVQKTCTSDAFLDQQGRCLE